MITVVELLAACTASGVAGGAIGHFWVRLTTPKVVATPAPQERIREVPLQYAFTLDGKLTNQLVPIGLDPVEMAARKSKREGRNYGVTRITPG